MAITRDRMRKAGGRFFDVVMGVFLIAVLVLIWNSSRGKADTGTAAGAKTAKKARIKRSPNIEALIAIQASNCVITCPADITVPAIAGPCVPVNFPAPMPVPITTCTSAAVCTPASGFCFPVGTTTVTCSAPGPGGAGQCSFNVTVNAFDVCLQDDSNPGIVFRGNSLTGAYVFCCGDTVFAGIAQVSRRGSTVAFAHYTTSRRVQAIIDQSVFKGTAAIQSPPGTTKCTIGDRDTRNNTCTCAVPFG
jgi:hypothetical protein